MAALTTKQDMIDLFSELGVVLRADDDDDGMIGLGEDRFVERSIRYATTRIQGYLTGYDDWALENSEWVREAATWMACYAHSRRRGNAAQFKEEHDRFLAELEKIRAGQMVLPDAVPCFDIGAPAMSNYVIDHWWVQNKQRVQAGISVGRRNGQDVDTLISGYMGYPRGVPFTTPVRSTTQPDGTRRTDGNQTRATGRGTFSCNDPCVPQPRILLAPGVIDIVATATSPQIVRT